MPRRSLADLTTREAHLKWWVFFIVTMGALHVLIYVSTKHAYPDLLITTVGASVITLASAAYNHSLGNEPDRLVRNVALAGMFLLVLSDVSTLIVHVLMGRDISVATAAKKEYEADQAFDLQQFKERAETQRSLLDSQAQADLAAAKSENAQAAKLRALPPDQRRVAAQKLPPPRPQLRSALAVVLPTPMPTPAQPTTAVTDEEAPAGQPNRSEAQARAAWRGWATFTLILTIVVAFCSTFGTKALKMYDADGDNVPDYVNRVHRADPELAARLYPEYADLLRGNV